MEALTSQDDALANQVIDGDQLIDTDENDLDKLAMHILMTRHPVASDLRFVTMSLKFVVDVERIGDLAAGSPSAPSSSTACPSWIGAAISPAWPRWFKRIYTSPSRAS